MISDEQNPPTPLGVLSELLANSTCFYSAVELDHGFDGEKWEKRAKAAIARDTANNDVIKILIEALKPFADLIPGPLDSVGGGTCVAPSITVRMVKDARSAIDAYAAATERT